MDLVMIVEDYTWVGWIALIVLFGVLEMVTLDFLFLMLALAGVVGLASDATGIPAWLQVIIAAIAAILLLAFLRPSLLRRLHRGEDPAPTGTAALLGMHGRVLQTTTTDAGQVKLTNGETWTARSASASLILDPGTPVIVDRIDGATAYLSPAPEGGTL